MATASRPDDQAELDAPAGAEDMGAEPRSHAVDKSPPTAASGYGRPAQRVRTCPPLPSPWERSSRETQQPNSQQPTAEQPTARPPGPWRGPGAGGAGDPRPEKEKGRRARAARSTFRQRSTLAGR